MNAILQRVYDTLKEKGFTATQMCTAIGLKQSTLSGWKSNDRQPLSEWISPISQFLGVSSDYLLTGVNMVELNEDSVQIRVLGRVAAGVPIEAVEDVIGEETISKKMSEAGDYFGLRISGDSMEPLIHHGAVVIVRQQNDLENGDIGIVMVNGNDATCKKIEKYENGIMLVPMNKAYNEKFYTNEEIENLPVRIIGKVVEARTKF